MAANEPPVDPVELTRALIRCPSITPAEGGAIALLQSRLEALGFACHRQTFRAPDTPDVTNLYARIGRAEGPNFCFAGHSDVVPVGEAGQWTTDPFGGGLDDGMVTGRGAADMKGAIACFVAAAARFAAKHKNNPPGAISLLITGDEEGPAINGTKPMLEWLAKRGEKLDACLVGEPTNPEKLGEMIKIGRRGSLTGRLTVHGTQGHSAYPHLADNPIHHLLAMLTRITARPMDRGTENFQPSTLQVTSIDVGNTASNVIPAVARAVFNIRFNNRHTGKSLEKWLRDEFTAAGGRFDLQLHVSGEAFLTPPGALSDVVAQAVEKVTGLKPELSTSGGTSDARFIKDYCPVAEFGLTGQTMHKVDERVPVSDLLALTEIYEAVLDGYFAQPR